MQDLMIQRFSDDELERIRKEAVVTWPPVWSCGQSSWLQIQRSGFDFRSYQIFRKVLGLERGPLSLVSTSEGPLGIESSGSGLEYWDYVRRDPSHWLRGTLYLQKFALTSSTSSCHSVDIVRSWTQATEFSLVLQSWHILSLHLGTLPERGRGVTIMACQTGFKPSTSRERVWIFRNTLRIHRYAKNDWRGAPPWSWLLQEQPASANGSPGTAPIQLASFCTQGQQSSNNRNGAIVRLCDCVHLCTEPQKESHTPVVFNPFLFLYLQM
jgi:hypothetical protein